MRFTFRNERTEFEKQNRKQKTKKTHSKKKKMFKLIFQTRRY